MDRRHSRRLVNEFLENAGGIAKAIGFEMFSSFGQALFNAFGPSIADSATQLFANLAG